MKTVIHVNQHIIRRNQKTGNREAPISIRTYRGVQRVSAVTIFGADGEPAAVLRYEPEHPLSCGARVWIELVGGARVGPAIE